MIASCFRVRKVSLTRNKSAAKVLRTRRLLHIIKKQQAKGQMQNAGNWLASQDVERVDREVQAMRAIGVGP